MPMPMPMSSSHWQTSCMIVKVCYPCCECLYTCRSLHPSRQWLSKGPTAFAAIPPCTTGCVPCTRRTLLDLCVGIRCLLCDPMTVPSPLTSIGVIARWQVTLTRQSAKPCEDRGGQVSVVWYSPDQRAFVDGYFICWSIHTNRSSL